MGSSFRFHVKILFIIMCGLGTGCMKKDGVSDNYEIVLKINGSSTIGTRLIPALAGLFLSEMGAKNINMIRDKSSSDNVVVGSFGKYSKAISIRNNGSVMGMEDLDNGLCDLCMSFESVIDQNKSAGMQQKVIGYDAMVMIVNRDNPINALDLNKLGDIFSGSVTSWSQFDVDDFSEVTLYMSEHTKLEIEYFKEIFLQDRILTSRFVYCKDDLEIASKVEHDKNGIGFVSMAFAGQNKVLAIKKGAEFFWHPEKFNISSMDYPFTRRLSLFSGQTSGTIADKFLQTAFSWNGRNITEDAGFIVSVCYADSSELSSKWEDFEKEAGSSRRISVSFRFVKESSELDSQSVFDLTRLSDFLDERFSNVCSIILMGFTDSTGSSEQNKEFSIKRAGTVADYLKEKAGFHVSGIYGFGELFPVAPNDTRWGRDRNRRVEVWLDCVSDTAFLNAGQNP